MPTIPNYWFGQKLTVELSVGHWMEWNSVRFRLVVFLVSSAGASFFFPPAAEPQTSVWLQLQVYWIKKKNSSIKIAILFENTVCDDWWLRVHIARVHSLVLGPADGDRTRGVLQLDVGPGESVETVDRREWQQLLLVSRLFAVVRHRVVIRVCAIPVRRLFGRSSAARRRRSAVGETAQRLMVLVARLRRRVFAGLLLLLSAVHGVSPVQLRPSLGHYGHGERRSRYFRGRLNTGIT